MVPTLFASRVSPQSLLGTYLFFALFYKAAAIIITKYRHPEDDDHHRVLSEEEIQEILALPPDYNFVNYRGVGARRIIGTSIMIITNMIMTIMVIIIIIIIINVIDITSFS